jgi:hypothetical protein
MPDLTKSPLSGWESFYVIVGSSAGALIGIQFVVVTLVASMRRRPDAASMHAFATPTVVHFACALLVSAILSAPWHSLAPASGLLALLGVSGIVYAAIVIRRIRRQTDYAPDREDRLWYAFLPCVVYAVLTLAALLLPSAAGFGLLVVGTAALALLFIGIRNSWDSVTHIALTGGGGDAPKTDETPRTPE